MDEFEQHIEQNIASHGLLRRGTPLLVGLSGGADSVALLTALCRLGYDCTAAHCNFHLRGAESQRDMHHASEVARQLSVNIYIRDFDVPARMSSTGESLEMACRELRYEWFAALLDRDMGQALAVGHHREDNIETMLINLLRGTGIAGLTGMAWRRQWVVRPMLDVSRAQIEDYLERQGMTWVNDSTNAVSDVQRNRLRNIVLPVIEEQFPGATGAMLATMERLADARQIYEQTLDSAIATNLREPDTLDLSALMMLNDSHTARMAVFHWLQPKGLNMDHAKAIIRAVSEGHSGKTFGNGNVRAELDRGILTIVKDTPATPDDCHMVNLRRDILSPIHIEVSHHHITEFSAPGRDSYTAYLDAEILDRGTVTTLRHISQGDRMIPFGAKGSVLMSKLMKNAGFSAADKRRQWVLTVDGDIVWAPGLKNGALYALTPSTRRYIRLVCKH